MNITKDNIKKYILGYGLIEDYTKIECWRLRGFFFVGAYTHLNSGSNIWNAIIGRYSRIDSNVTVGFRLAESGIFSNHYFAYSEDYIDDGVYKSFKARRFYYDKQNITFIGNDVRIHQGSLIHAGVTIGDGAIIYPNSVVDCDIPPYAVAAGNPARVIRYRFPDDLLLKIKDSNWFLNDLTLMGQDIDYSDIDFLLSKLSEDSIKLQVNKYFLNSYNNSFYINDFKRLVIGPSHVDIWQSLVNSGERKQPGFLMHGVNGLSLYSTRLKHLIDFFISSNGMDVVLLVPDFRIGNVILNNNSDISLDPLFISKDKIHANTDAELYEMALSVLDEFVLKYGAKIKLIFWCLIGREYENRKIGRYIQSGEYHHPTWNYLDVKCRYKDNILDIPNIENEIGGYICDNNTIHPNDKGYDFLEKHIVNCFS